MKTAIKIGCVAFGTLALATVTAYFMRRRKKVVAKIEPETRTNFLTKTGVLDSKEFVAKLKERKKKSV